MLYPKYISWYIIHHVRKIFQNTTIFECAQGWTEYILEENVTIHGLNKGANRLDSIQPPGIR